MKKTLLLTLLLLPSGFVPTLQAASGSGGGSWMQHTLVAECTAGKVCAEWFGSDGMPTGTFCCIPESAMSAREFGVCEDPFSPEVRPDGNPI